MTAQAEPHEFECLLDVPQLADVLGVNERHIRRLVFERRVPFIKWGGLVRFDPDDIRTWLDRCRHDVGPPTSARRRLPSKTRRRSAQAEPPQSNPLGEQLRFDS